jgi:hypothetical protein
MLEAQDQHLQLSQQLIEFEQQHPEVVKAMRLFGVTMTKYQETLHSLYSPRIYQSNTTAYTENKNPLDQ